jgi:hypothetical protein
VKVALCTVLAALPYFLFYLEYVFFGFIEYGIEVGLMAQNGFELFSIVQPYILFIVGSKMREHFANDWFFWKKCF